MWERYLGYRQVPNTIPASYKFLWGHRAHAKTNKMKVLEVSSKITNIIPHWFPNVYDEVLRDEQKRAGWQDLGYGCHSGQIKSQFWGHLWQILPTPKEVRGALFISFKEYSEIFQRFKVVEANGDKIYVIRFVPNMLIIFNYVTVVFYKCYFLLKICIVSQYKILYSQIACLFLLFMFNTKASVFVNRIKSLKCVSATAA